MNEFLRLYGQASADERRKNSIAYESGFSLKQLQEFIRSRSNKNSETTLSKATISWMLLPPNHKNKSSENYKGLFNVKVLGGKFQQILFIL